jgi:phosphomannomutase
VIWTLTGFKWIGLAMERLQQRGERYLFGAEESFGMEICDDIRDKDGVTAALLVGEMIGHYKAKGMTLFDAVEALYAKVGTAFTSHLVNLEDPRPGGAQRFAEAMDRIRKANLTSFAGEKVISWEDFQAGELHKADGTVDAILDRPELRDIALPLPKSNVLKFRLESGAYAAFRPSGTEPKLKVYIQSRTGREIIEKIEAEARVLLGL